MAIVKDGISHTADEVFESKHEKGIWYACVWTFNPKNLRVQIGAAYWHDADIAKFFAYRNSMMSTGTYAAKSHCFSLTSPNNKIK